MAVEIKLTRGMVALVDDADAEWLSQWVWSAKWCQSRFYAARTAAGPAGKRLTLLMHREIMKAPQGIMVDHRDTNSLNCQRYNLRLCTNMQNQQNRAPNKRRELPYKGVTRRRGKFIAQICVSGARIFLGSFKTAEEAYERYVNSAKHHFGEFARYE